MKKSYLMSGLAAVMLSGCAIAPVIPPQGNVFTSVTAPVDTDMDSTPSANLKMGQSESYAVLGLVAWGDASVTSAAKNGGITKVHNADYQYMSVLGFIFQKFTMRAWGE